MLKGFHKLSEVIFNIMFYINLQGSSFKRVPFIKKIVWFIIKSLVFYGGMGLKFPITINL